MKHRPVLAIVDMHLGNLQSVVHAFERVGAEVTIAARPENMERADGIVLPGVGAFGEGMASLHDGRFVEPIRRLALEDQRPLLGICLGMQLLADAGEEHGLHEGLGLVSGRVARLKPQDTGCRIPNMGWCDVEVARPDAALFACTPPATSFYFAHSYYLDCLQDSSVAATIDHGGPLTAAVERHNVFGVQFHPEKSQDAGLNLLATFLDIVARRS